MGSETITMMDAAAAEAAGAAVYARTAPAPALPRRSSFAHHPTRQRRRQMRRRRQKFRQLLKEGTEFGPWQFVKDEMTDIGGRRAG